MGTILRPANCRCPKPMGFLAAALAVPLLALSAVGCASTDKGAGGAPPPQRQATDASTAPATQRGFAKEGEHGRMEMYIGPNIPPEHLEREHR